MSQCPKCGLERNPGPECLACGVIYAKVEAAVTARAANAANAASKAAADAERAAQAESRAAKARTSQMNPCATCGADIARSAKACPHCGAKQKVAVGKTGMVLAGLFLTLMIVGAANQKPVETSDEIAARAIRDHPEIAAKATANIACTQYLKKQMRDPESLVIDAMTQSVEPAEKAGSFIVYTQVDIRARNGFGGMNREGYLCEAIVTGLNYGIKRMDKTS